MGARRRDARGSIHRATNTRGQGASVQHYAPRTRPDQPDLQSGIQRDPSLSTLPLDAPDVPGATPLLRPVGEPIDQREAVDTDPAAALARHAGARASDRKWVHAYRRVTFIASMLRMMAIPSASAVSRSRKTRSSICPFLFGPMTVTRRRSARGTTAYLPVPGVHLHRPSFHRQPAASVRRLQREGRQPLRPTADQAGHGAPGRRWGHGLAIDGALFPCRVFPPRCTY